jgi:hypothetical protein
MKSKMAYRKRKVIEQIEDMELMKSAFDKHIRKFDPYNLDGYDFKYEFRKVAK